MLAVQLAIPVQLAVVPGEKVVVWLHPLVAVQAQVVAVRVIFDLTIQHQPVLYH